MLSGQENDLGEGEAHRDGRQVEILEGPGDGFR